MELSPKEEILRLKQGESWVWPESDYGRAEIWCINDMYFLFEIPQFGGESIYNSAVNKHNVDRLIEIVESWT